MDESYGQFCTVARGAEALCERWTPLVVRELLCGSRRFNDIRRGVPRMSTSLLVQRLRHLESLGVVARASVGKVHEYTLTPAGEELRPIVLALGHWGARWIGSRLKDHELDAGFLMWDVRRFANLDAFPARPVVIEFAFSDARPGEAKWWLVVEGGTVDLCRDDPGREPTLCVESTVRALTEVWTGDLSPDEALRSRALRVLGPGDDARALWKWLGRSAFAGSREAARQASSSAPAASAASAAPDPRAGGSPHAPSTGVSAARRRARAPAGREAAASAGRPASRRGRRGTSG